MNAESWQVQKLETLLRQRRWEEAWQVCDRLARRNSNDPNLLVALLRASYAGTAYDLVCSLCNRILTKHQRFAPALLYKGLALLALAKTESALEALDDGLRLYPDSWELLLNRGIALDRLDRTAEAIAAYEQAIKVNPRCVEALNNLANALQKLGRDEDALGYYAKALALNPGYVVARYNRGLVLNRLWRFREALEDFEAVLATQPDFAPAFNDRSLALTFLGRLEEALESCDTALSMMPGFGQAWANRGVVLNHLGRFAQALAAFERAQAILGETAEILTGRAVALRGTEAFQAALDCHERAIALFPHSVQCFIDRGVALCAVDRIDEARKSYDAALELDPACPDAHFNKGLVDLGQGIFEPGWQGYEYRWKRRGVEPQVFASVPPWTGEELTGDQRLLIWSEQGVGDELLFASIYPNLADLGARCTFECRAKLGSLFRRSFPWASFVLHEEAHSDVLLSRISHQLPAGSLGRFYRRRFDDFPRHDGYLVPDPERLAFWKSRLEDLGHGLRVGFSWRSSKRGPSSTTLADWEVLFRIPGIQWISVQYDDCSAELDEARARFGVCIHRFPDIDYYDDLDELAALMKATDLVITAPTAVSRQSAALGVPTWQISFGHDWQTHGTEAYPWLPSLRRFHRRWNEPWQLVFDRVAERLRAQLASLRG